MIATTVMIDDAPIPSSAHDEPSRDHDSRPKIVRSEDLLQGRRELWIEHGEELYRLRLTRSGKLYLTK
jgi:hemin uptake protein HemP